MAAMFFDGSKFCEQFSEKSYPRNNPVKLFQNLTSGFRGEEFLKNFSEVHTVKKASPMAAIFFDRSKFREHFLKKVTQGTIL